MECFPDWLRPEEHPPSYQRVVVPLNQTGLLSISERLHHSHGGADAQKMAAAHALEYRWDDFCSSALIRMSWYDGQWHRWAERGLTVAAAPASRCSLSTLIIHVKQPKQSYGMGLNKCSSDFILFWEKKNNKTLHFFEFKSNSCPPAVETSSRSKATVWILVRNWWCNCTNVSAGSPWTSSKFSLKKHKPV